MMATGDEGGNQLSLNLPVPPEACRSVAERLPLPDAEVYFYRVFLTPAQSDVFLEDLLSYTPWKQERMKWYGKMVDLPRLSAWYGDPGKVYRYSGITAEPKPWNKTLSSIKSEIERVSHVRFNSALLNLYRDGHDKVSWHSDDEPELGHDPVIGSVSFGEARVFRFKHRRNSSLRAEVQLSHGSYLLMRGGTQANWLHEIPRTTRPLKPRINLTFRTIQSVSENNCMRLFAEDSSADSS